MLRNQGASDRWTLKHIPWQLMVRFSRREVIEAVSVLVFDDESTAQQVFEKARTAIGLIAKHDPRRLARIHRHVSHILFNAYAGASYVYWMRICRIGIASALRDEPVELAMSIVHESTHARLWSLGFRYDDNATRERVERICVRAEIDFALKCADATAAVERARRSFDTKWWLPEEIAKRREEDLIALGVPRWMANRLARLRQRRSRGRL